MQNHKLPAAIEDVASGPVDGLERALAVVDSSLRDKSSFVSVSALRTAQARLSELRQREGDSPAVLDQIERFLQRGCAIGILLDNEDERWSVQSLLDYWANLLGRSERVRPEVTLAEFDPEQAPELPDEKCPYLGLNAFQENDGPRFFGRSALIEQMVERRIRATEVSPLMGRAIDLAVEGGHHQRLLDSTLVVWGGEFGRTVYCQGGLSKTNYGRDHHPRNFCMWLAGGGVKGGQTYGETDDFSYSVADNPVHLNDLNATVLHCLGIDHSRFTFKFQGLDQKMTGVLPAEVIYDLLA